MTSLNRRNFLKTLGAGTVSLCIGGLQYCSLDKKTRPNIIYINIDDLGWKDQTWHNMWDTGERNWLLSDFFRDDTDSKTGRIHPWWRQSNAPVDPIRPGRGTASILAFPYLSGGRKWRDTRSCFQDPAGLSCTDGRLEASWIFWGRRFGTLQSEGRHRWNIKPVWYLSWKNQRAVWPTQILAKWV